MVAAADDLGGDARVVASMHLVRLISVTAIMPALVLAMFPGAAGGAGRASAGRTRQRRGSAAAMAAPSALLSGDTWRLAALLVVALVAGALANRLQGARWRDPGGDDRRRRGGAPLAGGHRHPSHLALFRPVDRGRRRGRHHHPRRPARLSPLCPRGRADDRLSHRLRPAPRLGAGPGHLARPDDLHHGQRPRQRRQHDHPGHRPGRRFAARHRHARLAPDHRHARLSRCSRAMWWGGGRTRRARESWRDYDRHRPRPRRRTPAAAASTAA